jgi:DNA-binding SARP family transcriptional activator
MREGTIMDFEILKIGVFGCFTIEKNGIPFEHPELGRDRVRMLLAYLILSGGMTRGEITRRMWPLQSEKRMRDNFHSTSSRLRKALGKECLVVRGEHFAMNPQLVHSETQDFLNLYKSLLFGEGGVDAALALEELYSHGVFYDANNDPFISAWRKRFHNLFIEAMRRAAELCEAQDNRGAAVFFGSRVQMSEADEVLIG